MNIHGERYANHRRFITYCRDLNVQTSERELEHYEKIGALLPVARVVYPDKYVIKDFQNQLSGQESPAESDEWPDLRRLTENFGPFPLRIRRLNR